jgi:hypothetical protein
MAKQPSGKDRWEQCIAMTNELISIIHKYSQEFANANSDEARVGLLLKFSYEVNNVTREYPSLWKKC